MPVQVAPTHLRGTLGSVNQLVICFGILGALVCNIVLPATQWRTIFALTAIPPVLLFLGEFPNLAVLVLTALHKSLQLLSLYDSEAHACKALVKPESVVVPTIITFKQDSFPHLFIVHALLCCSTALHLGPGTVCDNAGYTLILSMYGMHITVMHKDKILLPGVQCSISTLSGSKATVHCVASCGPTYAVLNAASSPLAASFDWFL